MPKRLHAAAVASRLPPDRPAVRSLVHEPDEDVRVAGAAGASVASVAAGASVASVASVAAGASVAAEPAEPWQVRAVAQVFVERLSGEEPLEISSAEAHHLRHVLRLNAGEPVVASDGRGSWCAGVVVYSPSAVVIEPVGPVTVVPKPAPEITVGFVPVKGDRPEWVVQKLTELGTDRIVVLRSARSVVRWDGDRTTKALERLQRVAVSAAAQSRRAWIPSLGGVSTLAELANALSERSRSERSRSERSRSERSRSEGSRSEGSRSEGSRSEGLPSVGLPSTTLWVCHMDGEMLGTALSRVCNSVQDNSVQDNSVQDNSASAPDPAASRALPALAVGPEGGWDASELAAGAQVVSLGDGVLRAETAAICAAALLGAWRSGFHRSPA